MLKLIKATEPSIESIKKYYSESRPSEVNHAIFLINIGYKEYVDYLKTMNMYYLIDDKVPNHIIGWGEIASSRILNDIRSMNDYGTISYSIKESERNKGYGTELLRLLLEECKSLGIEELSISCREDNLASKKIIEHNNGIFDRIFYDYSTGDYGIKYWIELMPKTKKKMLSKQKF